MPPIRQTNPNLQGQFGSTIGKLSTCCKAEILTNGSCRKCKSILDSECNPVKLFKIKNLKLFNNEYEIEFGELEFFSQQSFEDFLHENWYRTALKTIALEEQKKDSISDILQIVIFVGVVWLTILLLN